MAGESQVEYSFLLSEWRDQLFLLEKEFKFHGLISHPTWVKEERQIIFNNMLDLVYFWSVSIFITYVHFLYKVSSSVFRCSFVVEEVWKGVRIGCVPSGLGNWGVFVFLPQDCATGKQEVTPLGRGNAV